MSVDSRPPSVAAPPRKLRYSILSRAKKRVVSFTLTFLICFATWIVLSGRFDLFHIGHLNILKNAKKECDYLIVGITTDELCGIAKKKIPIIETSERMLNSSVAGLGYSLGPELKGF